MRVIVTGGGTGGHIYPALAVVEALKEINPDTDVLYIGSIRGLEREIVAKTSLSFEGIDVQGYQKKSLGAVLDTTWKAGWAVIRSMTLIRRFKPDVVFGTGGYVSGPVILAASLLGKATAIHEQNVHPGKTTRLLEKRAKHVYISFPETKEAFPPSDRVIFTGNPVRDDFKNLDREACRIKLGVTDKFLVLSFGGSGGAKRLNETMMLVMNYYRQHPTVKMVHVTGKAHYERYMKLLEQNEFKSCANLKIVPYLYDMPEYLTAADLVIGRAGATTIAELCEAETPSILIPSPNVSENHQEFNARSLERAGVSILLPERYLTDNRLVTHINEMLTKPEILDKMRKKFASILHEDAAEAIAQDLVRLAGKR
jgi:UDP-N-acetylglucosamine--N-acetylmuramyl-(pentapeptide) pyrophosphoryl-undecaprenol N-acetylglucosamine transferase